MRSIRHFNLLCKNRQKQAKTKVVTSQQQSTDGGCEAGVATGRVREAEEVELKGL